MAKHIAYECKQPCTTPNCPICDGGLFSCIHCNCAEGTLPTDCPEEPVSAERQELIHQGRLDFRDGVWVQKASKS